jgi:hypothetical protein
MKRVLLFFSIATLLGLFEIPGVFAQVPSSSNYSVPESAFGAGGELEATSASYDARGAAGLIGVGEGGSGSYTTLAGFITPDEEYVELVIPVTTVDLGGGSPLDPGTAGSGTATFSVRAYLNDNYVVISPRNPPTNEGGAQIDPMTTATTYNASVEQFGMNLVANTGPVTQGANPSLLPNASFASGEAAPGYNTANNYQYNAGDVIARSITRGYGETQYTISYVMNILPTTPAGLYRMEQDLVVTATF